MITTAYLHSSKDANYEKGQELGLSEKALKLFMFALYEVELEVDVNEETGEATILKVNGRNVASEAAHATTES